MTTECPTCGAQTDEVYRCDHCGRDLVDAKQGRGSRAALGGDQS